MRIPLSPMDYYFYRRSLYTVQFVFEYPGMLDTSRLSEALAIATDAFPVAGARLKILSRVELCLETGFAVPVRVQDTPADPDTESLVDSSRFLDSITNAEGEPLVRILVTRSPSKSLVGVSFSHIVGDGASFFQFMTGLSQILTSGRGAKVERPSNERTLLDYSYSGTNAVNDLFAATGYTVPRPPGPGSFSIETLSYSRREIELALRRCAEYGVEASANDILMAHLAKRYLRDIPLYEGKHIVRCPVDYRKIMGLPLRYFGNAVRDAIAFFEPDEIDRLKLHEVAARIRSSIQAVDRENVLLSLRCLNGLRQENGLGIFENIGCPGLLVSNLSKFPVPQVDLGLGAPIGFYHASLNPRLGVILREGEGYRVLFKRPMAHN